MDDLPRFGWDEDPDTETKPWEDWPRCPRCGTRRDTACPDCAVPGVDFALAELDPAADLPLPSGDSADGAPGCQAGGGGCGGAQLHSARAATGDDWRDGDAASAEIVARRAPAAEIEAAPTDGDAAAADGEPATPSSPASPGSLAVMLVCPICDEAFPPRFFRHCRDCGHDFGSGRELEPDEESVANYRVVFTMLTVLAVMAGISLYMFLLFR